MRILIIKMSSMGDILHTLPALSDLKRAMPQACCDWLLEEGFAGLLQNHAFINTIIPVHLRRFKGRLLQYRRSNYYQQTAHALADNHYDVIIDAQGLLKSAYFARLVSGQRCGYDWRSAREPLASLCYQRKISCDTGLHAITRSRELFAKSLGYQYDPQSIHYGLAQKDSSTHSNTVVLIPGASWKNKTWPLLHWQSLATQLAQKGYNIKVAWGSEAEKQQAQQIARQANTEVLPWLDLQGMQEVLSKACAYVGVETGFSHMAAALDLPGVCLLGPTGEARHAPLGRMQISLRADIDCHPCYNRTCRVSAEQAPCLEKIQPNTVLEALRGVVANTGDSYDGNIVNT